MKKLDAYIKKRNFKKTPEPKGKVFKGNKKNLFVVQKHDASHLHYDFRLELNGVLLSFAVPKGPSLDPTVKRLALHVEDHPIEYADFEGIIPKGEYGGGTVMVWDIGEWIPSDENQTIAFNKGHLHFELDGEKLKGSWHLFRLKKDDDKSWFLVKGKDNYAKSSNKYDILIEKPNSVLSGRDLDEIAKAPEKIWRNDGAQNVKNVSKKKVPMQNLPKVNEKDKSKKIKIKLPKSKFPSEIYPELATLVDKAPLGNLWLHEIKLDGYRIIAFKNNSDVYLLSRNQRDWTPFFANIVDAIKKLSINKVVFDGEVVLLDKEGRSNFQLLQNAIDQDKYASFVYYIFDLIYYDEYNLMSLPLIERKNILHTLIQDDPNTLRYNDHIIGVGEAIFTKACEMGLEGIVSKMIDSRYEQKRTKAWVKVKCIKREEFVIGGFSKPSGNRHYFGSLYLGHFNQKGELIYCGNVGTGFNQQSLKSIYDEMKKIIIKNNPFTIKPPGHTTATWVGPKLVCEVEFSEWTSDNILRHPSFKGLRKDKPAKSIHKETTTKISKIDTQLSPHLMRQKIELPFKLTNPNKILYAEGKITKLDLARYYNEIDEWILPYIIHRPLTLLRCPNSYKECFYQKHINKTTPKGLFGITVSEKEKTVKDIYIKDCEGLLALVQMGTLEIHHWGCRIEDIESPDMITFDLDPGPDVSWMQVVSTAKIIRDQLAKHHLQSFVKSTGGKGLHVVIPIKPEYQWDEVKQFALAFVQSMVANYPGEYESSMAKHKRKGKIFIDYLRNSRGATAISPYSTRARKGAPIATPLAWDELTNNMEESIYDIHSLLSRLKTLKKDPWEDFFKIKQSLHLDKSTKKKS